MKIGLPTAWRYHRYGPFWEAYLKELGFTPVAPAASLLEAQRFGAHTMPDENQSVQCLVGQVLELAQHTDHVLVPHINPNAPEHASTDPWVLDAAAILARRLSLPSVHNVPAAHTETLAPGVAVRLGQAWTHNAQLVRRALDRTQHLCKPGRLGEPRWSVAGKTTVGVVANPCLLETPALWPDVRDALEATGLHAVLQHDLPQERLLELGRAKQPNSVESELEPVGAALVLAAKGVVRGLVAVTQQNAPTDGRVLSKALSWSHGPSVLLELGSDVLGPLEAFAAVLNPRGA